MKKLFIISLLVSCSIALASEQKTLRERIFGPRQGAAPTVPGAPAESKTLRERIFGPRPAAPTTTTPQPQEPRETQTFFERLRGKPSPAQLQRAQQEEQERLARNIATRERLRQENIAREKKERQPFEKFISELIREVNKEVNREQKLKKARLLIDMNGNLIRKFGIDTQISREGSLCKVLTRLFDREQASDLLRIFAPFKACK